MLLGFTKPSGCSVNKTVPSTSTPTSSKCLHIPSNPSPAAAPAAAAAAPAAAAPAAAAAAAPAAAAPAAADGAAAAALLAVFLETDIC